jgi:1-acyl-sn-glycerol-3-phosphate acyltransferase
MRNLLFWPYQLYAWLVLYPLAGILTLVFSTLAVLLGTFVSHRAGSREAGARWARWIGRLTPVFVTIHGEDNMNTKDSYIVVCNHQSAFDIIVVYGWLDLDLKWVIKKEARKVPGIGIGCEKVGHIFVDRKNPKLANQAIAAALDRLGDGIGMLFFAEGTRSLDGHMLPFKRGAFRTAIELKLPILPVSVVGTRNIMPAKSLTPFPGKAELVIHTPIETADMDVNDIAVIMQQTREAIASALPSS